MHQAVRTTCARIEQLLADSHAFRQVDQRFYVLRQGSAYIYMHVLPWEPDRAVIRFVAQLARGVDMTPDLAIKLLGLNSRLRFGSFGFVRAANCVTLQHTLLGGATLDADELLATLRDLALLADEYDDRIVAEAGGQTMQEVLEEHEMHQLRDAVVSELTWETGEPANKK
jgi:hypothetical protein